MVERLIMLTKKVDDLLLKQPKIVKVIDEVQENCDICVIQNCPTLLTFKEVLIEYSNTFNTISQSANNPYCSTYTPVGRIIWIFSGSKIISSSTLCLQNYLWTKNLNNMSN